MNNQKRQCIDLSWENVFARLPGLNVITPRSTEAICHVHTPFGWFLFLLSIVPYDWFRKWNGRKGSVLAECLVTSDMAQPKP